MLFLWGAGDRCVHPGTHPSHWPAHAWACGLAAEVPPQSAGPTGTCRSRADTGSLVREQNYASWVGPCADKKGRSLSSHLVVTDGRTVRTNEGAAAARCGKGRGAETRATSDARGSVLTGIWETGKGPLKWHLRVVLHVSKTEPLNNFRKSKEQERRRMVASSRNQKWLSRATCASLMGEAGE